jgi:hypothetical protein
MSRDGTTPQGDAEPAAGALLSVGELQQALRTAIRARRTHRPDQPAAASRPEAAAMPLGPWLGVVGAAPAVGCSTVALLLAEALASPSGRARGTVRAGGPVHLVELAPASRSGLAAVTTRELGVDPSGMWRRGERGPIVVDRRADDRPPDGADHLSWPAPLTRDTGIGCGPGAGTPVVIDVGEITIIKKVIDAGTASPHGVLLVTRSTVPGLRAAETSLARLETLPEPGQVTAAGVVLVGERRLSGEVRASLGARLRQMRETGRIATVPLDARLESAGLSTAAIPRALAASGADVMRLVRGAAAESPNT